MYRRLLLLLCVLAGTANIGQALPPCVERPTFSDPPWVDGTLFCPELVIEVADAGELPFTALATAPDGTLYAARPLYGQVLAIHDSDGDLLPDTAQVIVQDLALPNGLTYHDEALYVAAGPSLYRWDGALTTLVDDLPVEPGGWVGGLAVGPDDRLYVGTDSGDILSFTLEGTDRRLVAEGLGSAAQMVFLHGALWATDSGANQAAPDALIRISQGRAAVSAFSFPAGSRPWGLAAYESESLPVVQDSLLVVLNGSHNMTPIQGYQLVAVSLDGEGQPAAMQTLIPQRTFASDREAFSPTDMNYRASGFWPHRPLDVTVSDAGWIYVSVSGGAILALRPLD